jgi:cell division protein FtsL
MFLLKLIIESRNTFFNFHKPKFFRKISRKRRQNMNRVEKYFALLAIANFFSAASMAIVSID